jgi:hypothetical protein
LIQWNASLFAIDKLVSSSLKRDAFVWLGPDDNPLPFRSIEDIEDFLRTADVVSMEVIETGITKPKKVVLEKDGIRMKACFRTVDVFRRKWKSPTGLKMNFYDRYHYENAAYELGKLLGVTNIPPVVMRIIDGEKGSIQAWLENAITEGIRIDQELSPPNPRNWLYQTQQLRVFDNLISNVDRNQGNILIDKHWNIWMIDATRAFGKTPDLRDPDTVHYCEKSFWEKLIELDDAVLKERLQDTELLSDGEFRTLLKRKEKLIKHIAGLIEVRGEKSVLVEF